MAEAVKIFIFAAAIIVMAFLVYMGIIGIIATIIKRNKR